MLNFEIAPDVLQPHVPQGLELDLWQGKAFVTVVGLNFVTNKVFGMHLPLLPSFEQVNLRLYVRKIAKENTRRGVVFIKEIVPMFVVSAVARLFFKQEYRVHPMGHKFEGASDGATQEKVIEYSWQHSNKWEKMVARSKGNFELPSKGSKEEFVVERYRGYVSHRNKIKEFQVEHPPWKIQQVYAASLDCDVGRLYGPEFIDFLQRKPDFAFVAEGGLSSLYWPRQVK